MSQSKSISDPDPNPRQQHQECFLTRLPPELRDKIYRLVLPPPATLRPNVHGLFQATERRERTNQDFRTHERVLSLARTCRQLHDEIVAIYFGENRFWFSNTYDLYRYLYMIGLERRRCIKSIQVFLRGVDTWQFSGKWMPPREVFLLAFDLLADCVQLKKLWLGVDNDTTHGTKYPHNDLLAVRSWGVFDAARGIENVEVRVRELSDWGFQDLEKHFNMEIDESLRALSWIPLFGARRLGVFERALQADMRAPKCDSAAAKEGDEAMRDGEEEMPQAEAAKGTRKSSRIPQSKVVKKKTTKRRGQK